MIDSELDPYVEWIAREARRPVVTDQAARDRIMASVRAEPLPQRRPRLWERVLEPRAFRLSPAGSALIAAGLVGIGVLAGGFVHNRDGGLPVGLSPIAVVPQTQLPVSDTVVKFVFVAPQAGKVSVVGDFNGWDSTKTPLVRAPNGAVWTVELPLSAGRHLYSFVVDGSWSADPSAPLAPDDGFGHANSVKLVRRGSAL
ncbi:MAG: glycoside hydrolase family 13 domain protein [Gemmatimonadetes bacterium]|nr:glycoside hydrolase family 13 domain protein [Gemmatimonadota bacterium]